MLEHALGTMNVRQWLDDLGNMSVDWTTFDKSFTIRIVVEAFDIGIERFEKKIKSIVDRGLSTPETQAKLKEARAALHQMLLDARGTVGRIW